MAERPRSGIPTNLYDKPHRIPKLKCFAFRLSRIVRGLEHFETQIKWSPLCQSHFQTHILVWNIQIFMKIALILVQWFSRWRLKSPASRLFAQPFVPAQIKESIKGLCEGNPPVIGGPPHKGSVTGKMFPFDDVIMLHQCRLIWTDDGLVYWWWFNDICSFLLKNYHTNN